MKRLSFLAALFGVKIAAQTLVISKDEKICWNTAKPCATINNRCPLCGTMAKPYTNPPDCYGSKGVAPCFPASQITRCATCNAAFWQDAEK